MSPAGQGVYIRLLCHQFQNGSIPDDGRRICRIASIFPDEWEPIKVEVLAKFESDGKGGLVNARMHSEREQRHDIRQRRIDAGKTGAEKRWSDKQTDSKPIASAIASATDLPIASTSTSTSTVLDPDPAPPLASPPKSANLDLAWDYENGFTGISEKDREEWAEAYPACNISRQLATAHQWLKANPAKAKKKAWRRFVTGWLGRAQERGGDVATNRLNGSQPAHRAEKAAQECPEPPLDISKYMLKRKSK